MTQKITKENQIKDKLIKMLQDRSDGAGGLGVFSWSDFVDEFLSFYSHLSSDREECTLPKKCEVKNCHNGFIPGYNGGQVDCEPCKCPCHTLTTSIICNCPCHKQSGPKLPEKIMIEGSSHHPMNDDRLIFVMKINQIIDYLNEKI